MAASSSRSAHAPQTTHCEHERAGEDFRVLYRRPELCIADARGVTLLVQLTSVRSEWLPHLTAAHIDVAERHGGPRPFVALCKLDPRFKLDVGFDQNLRELRSALVEVRPHMQACATIVSFDGVLGFTMRRALQLIGIVAGGDPPMHVCSTAAEAVCWIEPYASTSIVGTFDRSYFLKALQRCESLL